MENNLEWKTPNYTKENYPLLLIFLTWLFMFYLPSLVPREQILFFVFAIVTIDILLIGPVIGRKIEFGAFLMICVKGLLGFIIGLMAVPLPSFIYPAGIITLFSFFVFLLVSSNRTHKIMVTSISLENTEQILDQIDNWLTENNYEFERADNVFDLTPEKYDKLLILIEKDNRQNTGQITIQLVAPVSKGTKCLKDIEIGILEIMTNPV